MPEILTRLDFYQIGRRYLTTRATRIDPDRVDVEGSDANLFIGSQSYCAAAIAAQLGQRINALLLDGCEGEDLDRYAYDRYTLTRKGAIPAVGLGEFTRPTADAGAGTIAVGTKILTNTGIEYVTTAAASFSASGLATTARIRATQSGKEYQVGKNAIRRFATPSAIFDSSIIVNNPDPTAGGEPSESDSTFKERIRDFWNAARRGTLAAIEYGARQVDGVESANAIEVTGETGEPARLVELYIADSSGVSNATLVADVKATLLEWRAGGIQVLLVPSIPKIVDISISLSFQAGIDTVGLTADVRGAIVSFVNSLGVNKPLLRNDLGVVLSRFKSQGLIAKEGSIVSPAGDLYPDTGYTLRTRLENVQPV